MFDLIIHLQRDEDDYVEFPTRMPLVPRADDVIDVEGKIYTVDFTAHVFEDGEWKLYVWTKLDKGDD